MKSSAHIVSLFPLIGAAFVVVLAFAALRQLGLAAYKLGWALRELYNVYRYYPLLAYPNVEVTKVKPAGEPTSPPNLYLVEKVEDSVQGFYTPLGAGEKLLKDYTYRELRVVARELHVKQKVGGRTLAKRELILAIEKARLRNALTMPALIAA